MREKSFEAYLRKQNLSENTIRSYLFSMRSYTEMCGKVSARKIAEYREFLVSRYKPQTVNLRLTGLSAYLRFLKKEKFRPKLVKEDRKTFLQNVISNDEYDRLKNALKGESDEKWFFVVCFLGATGVRVSELVQLKIEHIIEGFADICSKGGKTRRIYIPGKLRESTLEWLRKLGRTEGFLFLNRRGFPLSPRGIASRLRHFAGKYNIRECVSHPHSFRHFFAKNFLANHGDIAFLADILGHESIDTTRIYLRKSSEEQQNIVDSVVSW